MSFHVAGSGSAEIERLLGKLDKRLDVIEKDFISIRKLVNDIKPILEQVDQHLSRLTSEYQDNH